MTTIKGQENEGEDGVLKLTQEDVDGHENIELGDGVILVNNDPNRETWDSKIDFLLSVIGFAVDLGNVWRFPYICFKNGGGAFLIPYVIMYIIIGLPLFYLELALGQFQRCGCITVWRRICPMFYGIGFGICLIGFYTAFYYNTIMAWALFYLFDAMQETLPWAKCDNPWNTPNCVSPSDVIDAAQANRTEYANRTSSTEEYFFLRVLRTQNVTSYNDVGNIQWHIALSLLAIFIIVYFALWKGVKSSGKAVWITATVPYVILFILLIRGVTLEGSSEGIRYYLKPDFEAIKSISVWSAAVSQIFFSLGPGFGVLLALSSYNKFHNNCYRDAMITSAVNCLTSFISGFVVFSVLGHMSFRMKKKIEDIVTEGPALVFLAYPEAIATMKGSVFFAIIFMIMLITLGLDSTFGGLESIITAVLDQWPHLRKYRKILVFFVIITCFFGALSTTTNGGYLVLNFLDENGAPISIIFIVFCECIALCWFYGIDRFSQDVQAMLGFYPGRYWRYCWAFVCPPLILVIFVSTLSTKQFLPISFLDKEIPLPTWGIALAWCIVMSSLIFIPVFMIHAFVMAKGSFKQRMKEIITPLKRPAHLPEIVYTVKSRKVKSQDAEIIENIPLT